jgi:aryl-alcohol dehydrogenase-like predicted oxidoreductase
MRTRFVGNCGIQVSVLAFGTLTFGGMGDFASFGATNEADARDLVGMCIDAGVNLFDTADIYSFGRSEEILGRALGKHRSDVLIATKMHERMSNDVNDVGQSRHHAIRACEASLRRLGTDYIDLYHVHGFDGDMSLERSLDALDALVRSGKVRYLACSNFSAWHLMKAMWIADTRRLEPFAAVQAHYSLVSRELELEIVPACKDQGIGVLVWGPLAGGLLADRRHSSGSGEVSRSANVGPWGHVDAERSGRVLDALRTIARERDVSVAQVSLNYILSKPWASSVILGARTKEQLADNLNAASWTLTGEESAALDEVSAVPLPYPYWHQRSSNAERMHDVS